MLIYFFIQKKSSLFRWGNYSLLYLNLHGKTSQKYNQFFEEVHFNFVNKLSSSTRLVIFEITLSAVVFISTKACCFSIFIVDIASSTTFFISLY